MKSLFLSEFDTTIRYHEIKGEGRPVIYLAALSLPSLPNFLSIATHPAMASRHSILIDYLGVGHSDHPEGFDYSLENHAKTIADVLDHENLKNCIVIGHSMGGTVGVLLAMARPDLVSHLFVCEGKNIKEKIPSMEGVYRYSIDNLIKEAKYAVSLGINCLALFPCVNPKLRTAECEEY